SDGNGKDATHSFKCVNGCDGYGNAVKHSWNNGDENPVHDCLNNGIKTYTCTVDGCGTTYTENVPATGHSFGEIVAAKNATCEAAGNVAYKQCTVCEKYFAAEAATNATDGKADTTTFAIAQLDHSYTGTSKNNNDGTHSFKCVNGCNQYGDATPHNFDNAAFTCICGEKFSGIYTDSADGNIYYIENGVKVQNKGLVKVVNNGHIHYYYFGCGVHDCSEAAKGVCAGEYAAQKNNRHWAENTNGLLLKGAYNFYADGVIEHLDDTSVNGISEVGGKKYYFIDGVKVHKGLFKDGNDYYYARSNGELVVNAQYYISKVNDTGYAEGPYSFDAEGKMVMANASGIVAEDGSLYYYENGVRTYAGLIEISGTFNGVTYDKDLIYVRTSGELAVDRNYWITKTNNLRPEMSYAFDADGKMVDAKKNGIVAEDGALYYYENGVRAYRGLMRYTGTASNGVKYNNALIYVRSNGQLATGGYWTTKHNGLAKERLYQFDANGVMIDADKNGIYPEDGSLFYYENGVRTYAGLIKIEDAYYYVRTSGEVVHGKTYWITKTNGEMKEGSYTFDEDGKMVIK
ncbi:MAG: hypothetical protein IKL89_07185, partial [Clostridia bacterium]|nr:hypothetical protein [Clostridia bacterium]